MKIENEKGDLLWAPNNFGTYSVDKVAEITDIISGVLGDLTINVHQQTEEDFGDYYNKDEINNILRDYLLRADYSDTAGPAIRSATNEYLESLRNNGTIVDSNVTDKLVFAADYWTRCCLNMSYNELINAQVAPSVTSFASRLDNLEGIQNSHSTYLSKIIQNMYEDTETRTGLLLSTRAFTGEGSGVTIGTGSNTYSSLVAAVNDLLANSQQSVVSNISQHVASLSTQVGNLDTRVNNLNYVNKSDVVTSSTNDTTKIPAASLEYQDRQDIDTLNSITGELSSLSSSISNKSSLVGAINSLKSDIDSKESQISDLDTTVSNLTTQISDLSTQLNGLSTQISGLDGRIASLESRVSALENTNQG